jgi:branched-chain amino acid transport system ATP-binding protein
MSAMNWALQIEAVAIHFGGVQAVAGVSFRIAPREMVGLIGPNGAGKTTLLRIIAGVLKPDQGRVVLSGVDVTGWPTARRVRHGLALTHQIVRPFRSMTVLENVTLAAGHRLTAKPFGALTRVARGAQEARAREILAKVGLSGEDNKPVTVLPLGHLKRLEVARALAVDPSLILLDEPLAGLNHSEAAKLVDLIAEINAGGITTVLVEHNLAQVMRVCRRLLVLDQGRIIADAAPDRVMADPAVREAYLGVASEHAAA